jgi:hypothetical protein
MARTTKLKLLKSNDKVKSPKEPSKEVATSRPRGKVPEAEVSEVKVKAETDVKPPVTPNTGEKKVSQKLLETLEKRRKNQLEGRGSFGKPAGRRGRRPKAMAEYTPGNQEEEAYVLESDHESIEYDTGIRVKDNSDDRGFNMDVDFDEELNFDW